MIFLQSFQILLFMGMLMGNTLCATICFDILEKVKNKVGTNGKRAKKSERFLRDAELLEKSLQDNPNSTRDVFYLAHRKIFGNAASVKADLGTTKPAPRHSRMCGAQSILDRSKTTRIMRAALTFLLCCIAIFSAAHAEETTGALIVSYQTGPKGERLDRIRFRLSDNTQKYSFYPQGTNYACDASHPYRIVVIEDLRPGNYQVEFLVPNTDRLFEPVTKKSVLIEAGTRAKIDQYIHPRYSSLHATAATCLGIAPFVSLPTITLLDETQKIHTQSANGELIIKDLTPGRYTLIFEELSGYKAPNPISLQAKPGEEAPPIVGVYECEFDLPDANQHEHSQNIHPCLTRLLSFSLFSSLSAKEDNVTGYGQISIQSNLPEGRWMIYRDDLQIYQGNGSESGIPVAPGNNYRLRVEELDGYKASSTPLSPFVVDAGQRVSVAVKYEKSFGTIDLHAAMPKGGTLKIALESKTPRLKSLEVRLEPKNGKIEWNSPSIPTGSYTLTLYPSAPYLAPPPQTVVVSADKPAVVIPEFSLPKPLKVSTGFPQATFTLTADKGQLSFKGSGSEYTFKDLPPGTYTLTFASPTPEIWRAPSDQKVYISPYQDTSIKVAYTKLGKLLIQSNTQNGILVLTPRDNPNSPIRQDIHAGMQTTTLPEGSYQTEFEPGEGQSGKTVPSQQIFIRAGKQESLRLNLEAPNQTKTVRPTLTLLPPPSKTAEMVFVNVAAGEAIIGDFHNDNSGNALPPRTVELSDFAISAYEVTNAQYAYWLNQALVKGKITYQQEGPQRGFVKDSEGRILCKTYQAGPQSQLNAVVKATKEVTFTALPDKANNPVVSVSWYGAVAYCQDNDCRLPTEAEWEKAAGMDNKKPYQPLKKFRYGFSRDSIDWTWANYKYDEATAPPSDVLSTEVGFYNGTHILPPTSATSTPQATHRAVSPAGAYDMSGNVWEWTADWFEKDYPENMPMIDPKGPVTGIQKVVKGGSYASPAIEVRVSERKPLAPDSMDGMTGFRVAK